MTDTTHYASDKNEEGVYIPKAYQFERDMDKEEITHKEKGGVYFDEEMNEVYVYNNMTELLETADGLEDLTLMLKNFFNKQVKRLEILNSYAHGKNKGITDGVRRLEPNKADYRIAHNYGGYIARFATSFLLSKPITISYDNEDYSEGNPDIIDVEEIIKDNELEGLDYEIGFDTSVNGRGYELHYFDNEEKKPKIVRINADEIFVIRDMTVKKEIIGAVHVPKYHGKVLMTIYTKDYIYKFEEFSLDMIRYKLADNGKIRNFYNDVPVVEWMNNRFREGDAESVLSIIDAYDSAQSDTTNYMNDLNDALLVVKGDIKFDNTKIKDMKDANILLLETGVTSNGSQTSADASYIYKQYDVQGVEAHKDRLIKNMFLLAGIPNLDEEVFGTASGISLRYKIYGLQQLKEQKVRYYTKALKRRYKLIENIKKETNSEPINSDNLIFTFHENLPENVWEEIKAYIDAGGEVSQKTLRENASFTDDDLEEERLEAENEKGLDDNEIDFIRQGLNNLQVGPVDMVEDVPLTQEFEV